MKMMRGKIIGMILISISILLSLANILSVKITGAIIGVNIESSLLTILTFVFFFGGLLFLSSLDKKLIGLAAGISVAVGGCETDNSVNKYNEKPDVNPVKITAPYWTEQGRFQRTYRWDKILDEVEDKYNLPKGILKGLAMTESYGDPLKLNSGNDGGAGLFMFQPGTAREMGLKVYGSSKRVGTDKEHGKELRKLLKENHYNYEKMAKIDERFDIEKESDAAARYLIKQDKRYGSWDKALLAFNQGFAINNPQNTKHVKAVREYQKYYNQRDKIDHKYVNPKVNSKGFVNNKGNKHR